MQRPLERDALSLLRQGLADPSATFREGQLDAILELVHHKRRLLVVQRTGWGKSMVYFIATRLMRQRGGGPVLLISPLLALMRNQVDAAERMGLHPARIDSSNTDSWNEIEAEVQSGEVDLLLISPERLTNKRFVERVLHPIAARVGMLVIDEAHCISDWGHDFRPDYLRIVRILRNLPPDIPVLATTATANDRVVEDVTQQIPNLTVIRGPLVRTSLRLQAIPMPDPAQRLAWLATVLPTIHGSGIVYVLTTTDAERVASWLTSRGIAAAKYTGSSDGREELEQALLNNDVKVVVATSALGMGFDKPDLAFVIHYQRPSSPVHYYQQVGRAGRALDNAYGILLEGSEDDEITDWLVHSNELDDDQVQEILAALDDEDEPVTVRKLEAKVNLRQGKMMHALKILHARYQPPVDRDGSKWVRTANPYRPDPEHRQRLREIRMRERQRMKHYVNSDTCLMEFLQRELNDSSAEPCGRCAVCAGDTLLPLDVNESTVAASQQFLRRQHVPIPPRKIWTPDALPQLEPRNSRIPPGEQMADGFALCRWGDYLYGERIRRGKQQDGHFDDSLVKALAEMIRVKDFQPWPTVVTWIPSLRTMTLVPDLATRLAEQLNLPAVELIEKVRDTAPQKTMENSHSQMSNLNDAFAIRNSQQVTGQRILLVDDLVDSRWTFTIAASLLRRAGAECVLPVALASTASGQ